MKRLFISFLTVVILSYSSEVITFANSVPSSIGSNVDIEKSSITIQVPSTLPVVFNSTGSDYVPEFSIENTYGANLLLKSVTFDSTGSGWFFSNNPLEIHSINSQVVGLNVMVNDLEFTAIADSDKSTSAHVPNVDEIPIGSGEDLDIQLLIERGFYTMDSVTEKAFTMHLDFMFDDGGDY